MSTDAAVASLRCAHHPSRPAADECPRCGRARCATDAAEHGDAGCLVCRGQRHVRRVSLAEVVMRSSLIGAVVAVAGAWIATQYVYDHIFSWVVPGLVGFAAAGAATVVNRRRDRSALVAILLVACVAALAGTALGFHLVPGGRQSVLRPLNVVGAPYVAALVGVGVWQLLFGTTQTPA